MDPRVSDLNVPGAPCTWTTYDSTTPAYPGSLALWSLLPSPSCSHFTPPSRRLPFLPVFPSSPAPPRPPREPRGAHGGRRPPLELPEAKIDLLSCSSYRSMGDSVPMSIINSISNFRVLFSSNTVETELVKRYGRKIDEILDLLKMVIDGALTQITPDDKLLGVLDELDVAINEALKLVGSWDWMMSRIYFYLIHCMILANYYMKVTQVEFLITKMQKYVLEVCQAVNSLVLPSETNCISLCMEKAKQFHCEKMTSVIGEASKDLVEKVMPKSEILTNIQVSLSLSTNLELLMEAVALSKIKIKVSDDQISKASSFEDTDDSEYDDLRKDGLHASDVEQHLPSSGSCSDIGTDKAVPADSRADSSVVDSKVRRFIEDLKNESIELQRAATGELLILSRHSMENRIAIANHGAIPFLVSLLYSDPSTQESAVTVLLNLSLNDNNKIAIASANAIEPLIHVLETGNPEAKANAAATLFSLSVNEENKARIGRSGAIKPLVDLLQDGNAQGKKDAATALFNLSIFHENKARIIEAGAVKPLVELMDPAAGMVDKAVSVLAILATVQEGRDEKSYEETEYQ
nr:unnamed protein product [Digitaria exilis]